MTHFYYQLKAKKCDHAPERCFNSPWAFPPVFSGMVEAADRKQAVEKICEDYGRKFPTRVLAKDLASHEFLLNVRPVRDGHRGRDLALFEPRECAHEPCGRKFRVIDKYNDDNELDKGWDFCTWECRKAREEQYRQAYRVNYDFNGIHEPVIYRILNTVTGKSYVGKTTQAFTLRWYQHFFQSSGTKFHEAVKASKLTDWTFAVVEMVALPADARTREQKARAIIEREAFWIAHFNAIEEGYNSTPPVAAGGAVDMDDLFPGEAAA